MRERIVTFGPNQGIVGILSEPDASELRPNAPFVLASNVGLHHRVGPYRLYVDLARRLASAGFPMLRFDLSGKGESAPRSERVSEIERAVLDVNDAIEMLSQKRGATRFVPIGLCSGVDSTHTVTVNDPRVAGAVFVEGYAFRTPRFYLRRYLRRPLNRRFWEVYLRRKARELTGRLWSVREAGEANEIYIRAYPTRAQLAQDYATMLQRNVHMLFVYSGGLYSDHAYNYAGQFADLFPEVARDPRVEVAFYPNADHVYSVLQDREVLMQRITNWLRARFP